MQTTTPIEPRKFSPFEGFLPFFWLSIVCTAGIITADFSRFPNWFWIAGFMICLFAWVLSRWLPGNWTITHRLRHWTCSDHRLPGVLVAITFFLGGWRLGVSEPSITIHSPAFYNNRGSVQITGWVIRPPDIRDSHTNLTINVESLMPLGEQPENLQPEAVTGKVLLQVPSSRDWAYGDRLRVTGKLTEPVELGSFSYKEYLANKDIFSLINYARVDWIEPGHGKPLRAIIYNFREKSFNLLQEIFPSPEADLLSGILLGRDQGLSTELQKAFQLTGMTHIIAISGFNITILAGVFSKLFTRILGHRSGTIAAVTGIAVYTILVGAEAAVVRAAIIGTIGVLGSLFGRRQNGLNSLGLAVIAMLLFDPHFLWDIGFQLSVAATLGLILYTQPMETWFIKIVSRWVSEEKAKAWVGPISDIFLITLAAQVMTLPIMAYHFGQVSWLALIANPLVLPPQSLVMILGGLALFGGLILPGSGFVLAMLALPFARYTVRMVSMIAQFPGAELRLPDFHVLWLLAFYALLFFITIIPKEKRVCLKEKVVSPWVGVLLLTCSVFLVWNIYLTRPDGNLHLTLLDQEGTILIRTPDGKSILIGGGSSPTYLNQVLGEMLPLGNQKLDGLIIASTIKDDVNALTGSIDKYVPESVFSNVEPDANQTIRRVYTILADHDVPVIKVQPGVSLELGNEIVLEFLVLEKRGAVLWLNWENFNALIPTGKVSCFNIQPPTAPDVMLLPDHLETEDLSMEIITQWSPSVILYPLKESDLSYKGECEVLNRLKGYPVISTLDYRIIRISTDGTRMWIRGDRKN